MLNLDPMFEAKDLSSLLADGESGGHDEIVTTGFRREWPLISVVGDVGSGKRHSWNGTQQAFAYDEENQYHPTPDKIGALERTELASAAASCEPRIDDKVGGISPPVVGTSADHFHQGHSSTRSQTGVQGMRFHGPSIRQQMVPTVQEYGNQQLPLLYDKCSHIESPST